MLEVLRTCGFCFTEWEVSYNTEWVWKHLTFAKCASSWTLSIQDCLFTSFSTRVCLWSVLCVCACLCAWMCVHQTSCQGKLVKPPNQQRCLQRENTECLKTTIGQHTSTLYTSTVHLVQCWCLCAHSAECKTYGCACVCVCTLQIYTHAQTRLNWHSRHHKTQRHKWLNFKLCF